MYIVLGIDDFNINSIFYQEKVKNTVMDNSNFLRVNYSNELFILNGIFIKFNLQLNMIEKSFNKYKCLFDIKFRNLYINLCYKIWSNKEIHYNLVDIIHKNSQYYWKLNEDVYGPFTSEINLKNDIFFKFFTHRK